MDLDLLPRHVVNSALRLNLPYFAFGCIIAVGGACSLVLARLRSRDRLLLWAGVFSLLYAARLFVQNELARAALNAPGTEYVPFALAITFTINVPFALFALELIGHGWKASIAIWVWSCGVFAVIAILATLFARDLRWVNLANGVLVVGGTLLLLAHVLRHRAGDRAGPVVSSDRGRQSARRLNGRTRPLRLSAASHLTGSNP